ncbi:AAA family ATPase [Peptoniphilus sp. HCN-40583]|uniref:AAA family ATPase n=1 Tax=Peptoniphilus sp. HCN-40583 TaxID=3134662 RepID=UPI0030C01F96
MNSIEKIILVNFQSHVFSELSLSKGVNVIVGPSDSGKTAIMRALRWNMFNDPSGVEFVREGETEVAVTIRFQNKVEVERRRSRSKNQYILRQPGEEELIFEGFGKNVPAEIEEAIGIKKVMLDDKKSLPLNFSDQLDGPFLLQETDAYKAQAIGRMVGVDLLDETMRDTLRDKKQISIRREMLQGDLEETEESLNAFSDLDDKIAVRDKVSEILFAVSDRREKVELAKAYSETLCAIQKARREAEEILNRYAVLDALEKSIHSLHNKVNQYGRERLLSDLFKHNAANRQQAASVLRTYENMGLLEEKIRDMASYKSTYDTMLPLCHSLASARNSAKINEKLLDSTKGVDAVRAMDLQKKFDQLIDYRALSLAYSELNRRINMGEAFLARFRQLDALDKLSTEMTESLEKDRSLRVLLAEQKRLNTEKEKLSGDIEGFIDKDKRAMDAYLNGLSGAGTCPLCKQPIDGDALHAIRHSLED